MARFSNLQTDILVYRLHATLKTEMENLQKVPETIEEEISQIRKKKKYNNVVFAFNKRYLRVTSVLKRKAEKKEADRKEAERKAEKEAEGKGVQKQRKPSPLGQYCITAAPTQLTQKTKLVAIPQPLPLPALESKKTELVPYTL
jgi:hypothetical protein